MPLGKLHVKVIRARNLRVADLNGASDPFVSLRLANASTKFEQLQSAPEFGKTTVVQKNLNPEWNEEFSTEVKDVHCCLVIHVWDKDLVGKDDLGWIALTVRHHADLLMSNKPVWLPLSLGQGDSGEIELQFHFTDLHEPIGTAIRAQVRENNVPVDSAANGVSLRESLIKKETRNNIKARAAKEKHWTRSTDGFDIPLPPGAHFKLNQFTGRWRLIFPRKDKKTYCSEYISIGYMFSKKEGSLEDVANELLNGPAQREQTTAMGQPAIKMTGSSSVVYVIDIGSRPMYLVFYLANDYMTTRIANDSLSSIESVLSGADAASAFKIMRLPDMKREKFHLYTYECTIETPPLWHVYRQPHFVYLVSPWSKTSIDTINSQQMDVVERIKLSHHSKMTAKSVASSLAAAATSHAGKTPLEWIIQEPTQIQIEGSKLETHELSWKIGNTTFRAYMVQLTPDVIISLVYESIRLQSFDAVAGIVASLEYLPGK